MPHAAHAAMREAARGPRRRRRPTRASRETEAGAHPRWLDLERVADRDEGAEPRRIVGSEPRFDLGEDGEATRIGGGEMALARVERLLEDSEQQARLGSDDPVAKELAGKHGVGFDHVVRAAQPACSRPTTTIRIRFR